MSLVDKQRNAILVRIVYDGPPFSGKTTTLRALSEDLSRPLVTPLEAHGRTLFFDWLDYTGGRCEGRPIRCQVVSVPGQRSLRERRKRLLAEADAVVFVADTARGGLDLSLRYARELREILDQSETPRPGIVVQANKRDVEDAVDMTAVIDGFRAQGLEVGCVASTATTAAGVKEAFVFAVRLALDRVRSLAEMGRLDTGRSGIETVADLLEQLEPGASNVVVRRAADHPDGSAAPPKDVAGAAPFCQESADGARAPSVHSAPMSAERLPDQDIPSGLIWPPIQGRIMLQQACAALPGDARVDSTGDITALSRTGWRLHSRAGEVFRNLESGRNALVKWARVHVCNSQWISQRRGVILSPRAGSEWRLWQLVGAERSLHDVVKAESEGKSLAADVERLLTVSSRLIEAIAAFGCASVSLPVRLDTVTAESGQPRYIGLMPSLSATVGVPCNHNRVLDADLVLQEQMSGPVRSALADWPATALVDGLHAAGKRMPRARVLAESLQRLCGAY